MKTHHIFIGFAVVFGAVLAANLVTLKVVSNQASGSILGQALGLLTGSSNNNT